MKSQRITIMLDKEIIKKLREKQSKQIKESMKSVSLSRVINESLRKCMK